MKRAFLKYCAAATIVALVSACGGSDHDDEPTQNIAELATSSGLTALVAAATKAGLADELSAANANLTVFAPTDQAFTTLATTLGFPSATALVNALDGPTLASILSYHVLPARRTAAELTAGPATQATIYAFDGAAATVGVDTTNGVRIVDEVLTSANVTGADQQATNGIVHVIDKVLVPPGVLNVVQMAQLNPVFSTLVDAVGDAGLADDLSDGTASLTVFAPTNDAFAAIANVVATLTPTQLQTVLTYHVLGDEVLSTELGPVFGTPVPTLSGQNITINAGTAPVIATITDTTATPSTIVAVDVRASNGVIHVIDKVLIPAL